MVKKIIWVGILSFTLAGCLALDFQKSIREKYVYSHPENPAHINYAILRGEIELGMTKEQVIASIGKPREINEFPGLPREEWIYPNNKFLYFDKKNDRLVDWFQY